MTSLTKLTWEGDIWFFDNIKKFELATFYLFFYLFIIYLGSITVQMVLHPKLKK